MNLQTTATEMIGVIGRQTLRLSQLEGENAALREQLEQAKADVDMAKFATEQANRLAEEKAKIESMAAEMKASRNGAVVDAME